MIKRTLITDVANILSMVNCAYDYGHANQIFFHFAANILKELTIEECEEYAKELAAEPGYGAEDYNCALKTLLNFRREYFDDQGKAL